MRINTILPSRIIIEIILKLNFKKVKVWLRENLIKKYDSESYLIWSPNEDDYILRLNKDPKKALENIGFKFKREVGDYLEFSIDKETILNWGKE